MAVRRQTYSRQLIFTNLKICLRYSIPSMPCILYCGSIAVSNFILHDIVTKINDSYVEFLLQVINGILALGRKTQGRFDGPVIGLKEAVENDRELTEDQLSEGKSVIGLQMGSKKGSSQALATQYGLGRLPTDYS